ncbi:hypothetical protein KCU85_g496, partial [Aureobasidium melanogenum]
MWSRSLFAREVLYISRRTGLVILFIPSHVINPQLNMGMRQTDWLARIRNIYNFALPFLPSTGGGSIFVIQGEGGAVIVDEGVSSPMQVSEGIGVGRGMQGSERGATNQKEQIKRKQKLTSSPPSSCPLLCIANIRSTFWRGDNSSQPS